METEVKELVIGQVVETYMNHKFEIKDIFSKDGEIYLIDPFEEVWSLDKITKAFLVEVIVFDWNGHGAYDSLEAEEFTWTCISFKHNYDTIATCYGKTYKEAKGYAEMLVESLNKSKRDLAIRK